MFLGGAAFGVMHPNRILSTADLCGLLRTLSRRDRTHIMGKCRLRSHRYPPYVQADKDMAAASPAHGSPDASPRREGYVQNFWT